MNKQQVIVNSFRNIFSLFCILPNVAGYCTSIVQDRGDGLFLNGAVGSLSKVTGYELRESSSISSKVRDFILARNVKLILGA
jgi:hypothetical protein